MTKNILTKCMAAVLLLLDAGIMPAQDCGYTDKAVVEINSQPCSTLVAQLATANQAVVARDKVSFLAGFSFTNASTHTFSAYTQNTIIPEGDYTAPGSVVDGSTRPLNTSTCVPGTVGGSYSVGPDGGLTYDIPVQVSPGTRGMQPELHITYKSHSGNGLLGWDWHLGGISAITRVPKSTYYDDANSPVTLAALNCATAASSSGLSLDGQRLIWIAANTFVPENNPYTRVVYNGTSFTVTTQSGVVILYGSTADERFTPSNAPAPMVWGISKVIDADNNFMAYSYIKDATTGEYRINEIKYTGNTSGASPYNSVKFVYSRRTDVNTTYIGGYAVRQTMRLDAIRVFAENMLAKEYTFSYYTGSDSYTRLNQVSLVEDGVTYNPTIVNWGNTDMSNVTIATASGLGSASTYNLFFGELNGDGKADVVKWNKSTGLTATLTDVGTVSFTLSSTPLDVQLLDWDNDGKNEVAVHLLEGTNDIVRYYDVTSTGFSLVDSKTTVGSCSYLYGDFNGDGLMERFATNFGAIEGIEKLNNVQVMTSGYLNATTTVYSMKTVNVDGDGIPEILVNTCSSSKSLNPVTQSCGDYILKLSGTYLAGTLLTANTSTRFSNSYFGDFNGDGQTDRLYYASGWNVSYGTGSGFTTGTAPALANVDPSSGTSAIRIVDVNADGKADIIQANGGTVTVFLSTGYNSFVNASSYTVSTLATITGVTLDVANLDASLTEPLQIVYGNNQESYKTISFGTLLGGSLLATGFTDGFNNNTAITYSLVSTATTSTPLSGFSLIKEKMLLPTHVVKTNGMTTLSDLTYAFANAYAHQLCGFVGFTSLIGFESISGVTSTSTYSLTYINGANTCIRLWLNRISTKRCNSALSTETYTNEPKGGDMSKKCFLPLVTKTISKDELTKDSTITEITSFDVDMGVTSEYTTKVDDWTFKTNNNYSSITNNEVRLNSVTSTFQKGTEIYQDIANYEYDNAHNHRILSTTSRGITSSYTDFDAYGNVKTTTQTPTDGTTPARNTSCTFDNYGRYATSNTNAEGYTSKTIMNTANRKIMASTNINNLSTTYDYTSNGGKLINTIAMPDGQIVTVETGWDNSGSGLTYSKETQSTGNTVLKYFDARFQPVKEIIKGINNSTLTKTYNYNTNGTIESETDNSGRRVSYTYEQNCTGRLWKKTCTETGIDLVYSYNGLSVTQTNSNGNNYTTSTFDGAGNLKTTTGTNGTISYDYFPSGKIKSITADNKTINYTYHPDRLDLWTENDPDLGVTSYTYNGFGQIKTKQDAKNQKTTFEYDANGRLQSVTGEGAVLNMTYTYSSTPGKLGLVESVTRDGVTESYTYDNLCRPLTATVAGPVIPGASSTSFTTTYTYDPISTRLATVSYPTGLKLSYVYDAVGNITRIDNATSGGSVWSGNTTNSANQWTQFTLGNSLITKLGYGGEGLISTIQTGTGTNPTSVQNLGNTINSMKLTTNRTDGALSEGFSYDATNRLKSDSISAQSLYVHRVKYLPGGNIDSTSIAGKYNYMTNGVPQPHAVSQILGITPATGSNSSSQITCLSTYNIDNKTVSIDNGTFHDDFTYGPNGNRFRLDIKKNATLQCTKVYIGDCEYGYSATGTLLYARTIISAPTGVCAMWQDSAGRAQDGLFYIHTDNQGSWLAITNATGTVTNRYSYDAWGRPRDYQTWYLKTVGITTPVATLAALQPRFDRGYTGQEHMAAFGLINMNGRIYDPYLQRFLSADPIIQEPTNQQNFNRYSYCLNNPLSYTDPTGYNFWKKIKKAVKKAVSVVTDLPFSVPVIAADFLQDKIGHNFITNIYSDFTKELYTGRFDPIYYTNRICGNSRIKSLNDGISGKAANYLQTQTDDNMGSIWGYEHLGEKRVRKLHNVTSPADEYVERPSPAVYREQHDSYYNFDNTTPNKPTYHSGLFNYTGDRIWFKPDNSEWVNGAFLSTWGAYPLENKKTWHKSVDGINVDGQVWKISTGYLYVDVKGRDNVDWLYPPYLFPLLSQAVYPFVKTVDENWLNEQMYNEDGSHKYYGEHEDYQWFNIFHPKSEEQHTIPDGL